MSLSDELAKANESLTGSCPMPSLGDRLDDASDRTFLEAAQLDPAVAPDALAVALSAVGARVSPDSIRQHRAGTCPCAIPKEV